ncbi:autotransporter-associated beta strand protein [Ereboglobus sp. PH5-10]|uniref:polysaccharide lyase family protein n=1 Tax=Ereboglobus sp. PH5-10 TaxID=2940629 RepID=UPI002405B261|nr:polysaccharide lyase family protein [Ereboglobus sp. PH5-10]MDF9827029.1 autotransporter-associated beta strand protein [Ereboglobus sp. PH5-10]
MKNKIPMPLCALLKTICFAVASLCAGLALAANDPGGGANGAGADVTLSVQGNNVILSNGIITATINTANARVISYLFNGTEMVDAGGYLYYSMDGGDMYESPTNCVYTVTVNTPDMIDISCKAVYANNASQKHPFDIDCHFVLRRGDTGLYSYTTLSHPASYPAASVGEWRMVWKLPYTSTDWIFERIYADENRNGFWGTRTDFLQAESTSIAEIIKFTTGERTGEYDCKYQYALEYQTAGCWGHASNVNKKGAWFVLGGYDYLNDGPIKNDLAPAESNQILHFGRNHYNASETVVAAGEEWSKIYGPFLLYCNSTNATENAGDTLWADAKAQVQAEIAAWPYAWLATAEYPAKNQRGDVKGKIIIVDSLKPALAADTNTWIGLSQPDEGGNWQFESKRYQTWVHPDENGNFIIPAIRPGNYTLSVFTDGAVGEYTHPQQVTVTAGETNDLGDVTWNVMHPGERIIWEIGVPNRRIDEFRHGNDYWKSFLWEQFHKELPNPLEYIVGESDWSTDWNYVHSGYLVDDVWSQWKWRIRFNLDSLPTSGNATLTLAFASIDRGNVRVYVNQESSYVAEVAPDPAGGGGGGNALARLGNHAKYSLTYVTIPLSSLRIGANTITLVQRSTGSAQNHVMYDYINLEMPAASEPLPQGRDLIWRGGNAANAFDSAAQNFIGIDSQPATFSDGDTVTFDDTGSNSPSVAKTGALMPASIIFNTTKDYTIEGSGLFSGPMTLQKTGASRLILSSTNTYYGGTQINGGIIQTGTGNNGGIGWGAVTFNSGTLQLHGYSGSQGTTFGEFPNTLTVPEGKSGTLLCPPRMAGGGVSGPLTGSGTLTVVIDYVRGIMSGDWSLFSGQINVVTKPSPPAENQFRISNDYGYVRASVDLGEKVMVQNIQSGNDYTIEIGALSGAATARIQGGPTSGKITTWRVGAKGIDTIYAGSIENLTGPSALTKVGEGTLTLTGVSTYTGATNIDAGTLVINGALGATTATVNAGAMLAGTGTIGGNVQAGNEAILRLPETGGGLAINGSITLSGTITIESASATPLATGTYTILKATGGITNTAEFIFVETAATELIATVTTDGNTLKLALSEAPPTPPAPIISSPLSASAIVGQSFSYTIAATNSPVSFAASNLPSGLSISGNKITGTPTVAGTANIEISATNAGGTDTKTLVITVIGKPAITNGSHTSGMIGTAFSLTINASGGSITSYTATGLPGGLSINTNTGKISGTPSTTGTFNVTLTVTNAAGSTTFQLTLTIDPKTALTTLVGAEAGFDMPSAAAADAAGNLYIADTGNNSIRKISANGAVTTFATGFNAPASIVIDAAGTTLYVADTGGNAIKKIGIATGAVGTLALTGAGATLDAPHGLALDAADNLYVADTGSNTVRKIVVSTGAATIIANTSAGLNMPMGLALNADATALYIADTGNSVIRRITLAGALVETIAGLAGDTGSADGPAAAARFNTPQALVLDTTGNLYIADTGNHIIRKIDAVTNIVTTVAGTAGTDGSQDGIGTQSTLTAPAGIVIDGTGEIYVLDTGSDIVRVLQVCPVITTSPVAQTVTAGTSITLKAEASGAPTPDYQWYKNNTAVASATNATLVFTSAQTADTGSYHAFATNPMGSAQSKAAALTVTATTGGTTAPNPDPGDNSNAGGGGGGGAPSLWHTLLLASLVALRLRCKS